MINFYKKIKKRVGFMDNFISLHFNNIKSQKLFH